MLNKIHPSAIISEHAHLGSNVEIGPFSIVHDHVTLGDGTSIGAYCEIGIPSKLAKDKQLIIGKNSTIRSRTTLYAGSVIGDNFTTGHSVTVRENMKIGKAFQIGTLGDVQGDAVIGNYVKCHSNVHICKTAHIEDYVWIFPFVVLTNDPHPPSTVLKGPHIEKYVAIATMSIVLPGVRVGHGALIGAHTLVRADVKPNEITAGVPGKSLGRTSKITHSETGDPAYPWRRHFHNSYPDAVVEQWIKEFEPDQMDT